MENTLKIFNLFKEIIIVDKPSLLQALNTSKLFGINIKGEIVFAPYKDKEILIFNTQFVPKKASALMPSKAPTLSEIFGKNYQVVEDEDRVLIKAFSNWQDLIQLNTIRASYNDTTGDGVDEFADDALEDIGWHAVEFGINYRLLVEQIEANCEGTLFCIEQEEPYQFSGLGFIDNDEQAREMLFNYCQNEIKKILENNTIPLNDDQEEAAEFFKCL